MNCFNQSSGAFLLPNANDLKIASSIIKSGNLVAVPTETVYGLAGNALNESAIKKIFETKKRPLSDPLIVHVHSLKQVFSLTHLSPFKNVDKLFEAFWPGAITLIFPKNPTVPSLVTAGLDSIAVRMPSHPVFRSLLKLCNVPLAAPSANPFAYVSPTSAQHVRDSFGIEMPVIDGGTCLHGVESTVLSLLDPMEPVVLRPGPVSAEAISSVLDLKVKSSQDVSDPDTLSRSPGMMKKHYSPNSSLVLFDSPEDLREFDLSSSIVICIQKHQNLFPAKEWVFLSKKGDINEAAKNVFSELRKWDSKYNKIYFQRFPNSEIGIAVNDRLKRAAAQ
jgi:L-threonylcarbamoyladenylate synthase